MSRASRKKVVFCLLALLMMVACSDTSCGGCATPLPEPFSMEDRVYDAVQMRVNRSGFDFIQNNLSDILGSLMEDGLTFEIPNQNIDLIITDVDLCQTPCPLTIEIAQSVLSLVPNDTIGFDGAINVDGVLTLDTTIIVPVHCDFPLEISDKPFSADLILKADPDSHLFYFEIANLELTLEENDYDIECPIVFDQIMEALKGALTSILNLAIQSQLDSALGDLIAAQSCLNCDFYSNNCPTGSTCNGDDFCESGGECLIKPLGLVGTLELGEQLSSVDPNNDAAVDLLLALGQAQQPSQRPFIRNNGLEMRLIGGTYSDLDECLPEPDPQDIPSPGLAPAMNFGNVIPGTGDPYMMGVAITDKYLDYFFYQLWRSGFLCLAIDSYGIDQISSATLGLFIPSINLLADQENLPVRLELRPQGVPYMEIGSGTFLPDGSIDEPILYLFLPELRMDFWMKLQGRWFMFLSLVQDVRVDLAIDFTDDNQVIPIIDENSVVVDNVFVSSYELLAEDEETLKDVVPQLIGMFLPMLTGSLGEIAIPDLQGFILDVKSVEGNLERGSSGYHEFMSIYADLSFEAPPAPVATRVEIASNDSAGIKLRLSDPATEIQFRIDGGMWSPFKSGPLVEVTRRLLPGEHNMEVRARRIGEYRSLDPDPQVLFFETSRAQVERPATDSKLLAPQISDRNSKIISQAQTEEPRVGCATAAFGSGLLGLLAMLVLGLRRRK
jgi:hypothetical protein